MKQKIPEGYLYARVLGVQPGKAVPSGLESLTGLIKLGKARELKAREQGYREWNKTYYPMMYGPAFAAVRVEGDYSLAESLSMSTSVRPMSPNSSTRRSGGRWHRSWPVSPR